MQNEKVKAGVLLYALLMAAIFSLLLQFFRRRVAEKTDLKDLGVKIAFGPMLCCGSS